jgi:hypothetical protein
VLKLRERFQRFFNSGWSLAVIGGILLALIYPFLVGHPILVQVFISYLDMPYGNVFAWLGLILFPWFAYLFLMQTASMFSQLFLLVVGRLVRIALFMGIFWGIIGYYLSGNWRNSFTPQLSNQDARAEAFWLITGAIPILTLLCLLATAIGITVYVVKRNKK